MKKHILTLLLCCCGIMGFSQSVTNLEYFFNTDPGFGNATSITANTNTGTVTQTVSLPVNSLTGFNTLYLRAKDNLGKWSLYDKRIFYVAESSAITGATKIAAAEYFINTDPGFGNAFPITVNTNTGELTQVLSLPIGNIQGFNTLYIRTKDDLGVWSMYEKRIFYVTESSSSTGATKIAAAEYFINTDPGFGNASTITVNANTGELTQILSLPVGSLQGFNTLYIRTKDDLGKWSMYDKRLFYIRNEENLVIPNITAAEYFYDADPGFGNGTPATITPTAKPNEYTIQLATTDITCNLHDFYIRLKNSDGKWSLYDNNDLKKKVDVYDNAKPTIVVFPNITKELDATGKASVTIADVNNGTYDDCQLASVVLNQTKIDYTCTNLGTNTVKVTATDAENKVSTLDVTITVVDKIKPVAVTKNITVQLDANGKVMLLSSQIENGSTDNCSITGYSLDVTSFDCSNLGPNTVNLTVSDSSGNANTASAVVTVVDTVKPTVITQAITVQLDANGTASITANDIDNNSFDNCTLTSKTIDISSFSCLNLGKNTVTLTAKDQSGNSNSTTAIVTVIDAIKPAVVTKNITVQLNSTGQASIVASQIENGSTDNCSIVSSSLDITNFTCSDLGNKTVILSVTDTSGNIGTGTAIVTVVDVIKPVAITKNISMQLDASGKATITPNDIDNSSMDNCSITSKSLDKTSFTCADLGANTVKLTVSDSSGNTNFTTAIVTILDAVKPSVVTKNITVQLNSTGQASIVASQIENGSTDNCSIASSSLDKTNFTCSDLGNKTVTLSVTDTSGNIGTGTAIVTVVDAIKPVAITKNINIQLDASGKATITPNDIDNSSMDNCSITSKSLDKTSFTCADLGNNNVILTVSDSSGNSANANAIVTIVDAIKPTALGKNITVFLNGNPSVTILPSDIDNGSYDNCSTVSLSIDVNTFNSTGSYPVILTVKDSSGNSSSTTVTITVGTTLGIKENEQITNQINLFPIPTSEYLNIATKLIINTIEVFDVNGRKIDIIHNPGNKIETSRLPSGTYILKLYIEDKVVIKRIIKQ